MDIVDEAPDNLFDPKGLLKQKREQRYIEHLQTFIYNDVPKFGIRSRIYKKPRGRKKASQQRKTLQSSKRSRRRKKPKEEEDPVKECS